LLPVHGRSFEVTVAHYSEVFTGLTVGYGRALAGVVARSATVWTASARSASVSLLTG
jgi:hypothetical protein